MKQLMVSNGFQEVFKNIYKHWEKCNTQRKLNEGNILQFKRNQHSDAKRIYSENQPQCC